MNAHEEDRIKQLLRQAVPPIPDAEPDLDLWPAVLHKLDARPSAAPWFDWALAAGLIVFAAFAPSSIPVLLYYL